LLVAYFDAVTHKKATDATQKGKFGAPPKAALLKEAGVTLFRTSVA
jgi:hypothetical protein